MKSAAARHICAVALLAMAMAAVGVRPVAATAPAAGDHVPTPGASLATFEGRTIDLAQDWEGAQACISAPHAGVLECFGTEQEAEERSLELEPVIIATGWSCSTPLRLYQSTVYGGQQVRFYSRGYWQNLADYGFDNKTSSYAVGACSAYLADGAWGGGLWYPISPVGAGSASPWMVNGWDDRISSIHIN